MDKPKSMRVENRKGMTRKQISEESAKIRQKAMQMLESGISARDVAENLNVSYSTVCEWRAKYYKKLETVDNINKFGSDENTDDFKKQWTEAINRIRKFCGLPLFK